MITRKKSPPHSARLSEPIVGESRARHRLRVDHKKKIYHNKQKRHGLTRAESVDAMAEFKGTRLANKFVVTLHSKKEMRQGKEAERTSYSQERKPTALDAEEHLKQALVDGITHKVTNLTSKIQRMKLDVRQQLMTMDTQKRPSEEEQLFIEKEISDGSILRKNSNSKFGENYGQMLRQQKRTISKQKRRKAEQAKKQQEKSQNRAKSLLKTLEKRHKAANSGGGGSNAGYEGNTPRLSLAERQRARKTEQRAKQEAEEYEAAKDALRRRTIRDSIRRQIGKEDFAPDGTPPFELPARELLHLIARELRFKDDREKSNLQKHLQSYENQDLLTCAFWYIYLAFFDPRYPEMQDRCLGMIAEHYMRMLDLYGRGTDKELLLSATAGAKQKRQRNALGVNDHHRGPVMDAVTANPSSKAAAQAAIKRTLLPHAHELFAIAHNMTRAHDAFFRFCPLVCGLAICYGLHFLFPKYVDCWCTALDRWH